MNLRHLWRSGRQPSLVFGLVGGWSVVFVGLVACTSPPPDAVLSPPVAEVSGNAWVEAERIATQVPASTLMVGHGASMLPLYPNGTVLVLQVLQWDHLRPGMTVVYYKDGPGRSPLMVAHVLKARDAAGWRVQGLGSDEPDQEKVTPENYIGTVVAACHDANSSAPPAVILQHLAVSTKGNCLMRCHVDRSRGLPPSLTPISRGLPDGAAPSH